MSWDMSCPNVSDATTRGIMYYQPPRLPEIRNTEITNVRAETALLLVNYATECVPAATSMGWMWAKRTFAGASIVASCDIVQKSSPEISIPVTPSVPGVYVKFKQNRRPSKTRLLAGMEASNIRK